MAWRRRLGRGAAWVGRAIVAVLIVVLTIVGVGLSLVETGWAKNRIRALLVRQANEYLTATLSIGRLEGSLFRGIQLGDVDVSRNGETMIHIDEIALAYSIRELTQPGVVIRSVRLTRPYIVAGKQADGKWDLGTLIKRDAREQERTGPSRPIEVQSIQIADGRISLRTPLDFGAAHIPTQFSKLDASFRFAYFPVRWVLDFDRVAWIGRAPDLSVNRLAGRMGRGPGGWFFQKFSVETATSAFTMDGRVNTAEKPTVLDLRVVAARFAFQEWSGVLRGLKEIAVNASFDTSLKGPLAALGTTLELEGTGGAVKGHLTLDTTVPGWHGSGAVDIAKLNLARWLNRADRPSDITAHVTFDLALELGRHFPRGVYAFNGSHAMYMNYAADAVRANGQITQTQVLVADASGLAYGANVTVSDGSIGIDAPFPYRFRGRTTGVDLRRLPAAIPVPHVESVLALDYDVSGRFRDPYIAGDAVFGRSEFLGARIGAGTVGSINTERRPVAYSGEGDVDDLSIHRFGEGLDVAWMRDPRYAATVSGRFRVEGAGGDGATMTLKGGGRLARANVFKGTLSNADVSVEIADGSLQGSYDGAFANIDPAIAFNDARFDASMTGTGRMNVTARGLLTRSTTLDDYDVHGSLTFSSGSEVRGLHVETGALEASLAKSVLAIERADMKGPELDGTAHGALTLGDVTRTDLTYEIAHVDLARVRSLTGLDATGDVATKGRLTGPSTALRAAGDATVTALTAGDLQAMSLEGSYDVTFPSGDGSHATGHAQARGSSLTIAGEAIDRATGDFTLDETNALTLSVQATDPGGRMGGIEGRLGLRPADHAATLLDLTVTLGSAPWRLAARTSAPAVLSWDDHGIAITPVEFVSNSADERSGIAGTWRYDGTGALQVKASHVFLDTLEALFAAPPETGAAAPEPQPARYGGVLDLTATLSGTRAAPRVNADVTVSNGRVDRMSYDRLSGHVAYANRMFDVDLTLNQTAGVEVTAVGTVPLAYFRDSEPEQPVDLALKSSGAIDLRLLAGLTDVIHDVSGNLFVDVRAIGTNRDPHFAGKVRIEDAGFTVAATGSKYKNARLEVTFTRDLVTFDSLHVVDASDRTLDATGSLATHELRVGNLEMTATARRFELMRNEFGRIMADANLRVGGTWEQPRLSGDLSITAGEVRVDEVLQRSLSRPYATEPTAINMLDAVAALNPWDRLAIGLFLHVSNPLRLTGKDIPVTQSSGGSTFVNLIGVSDINLRVSGDLYLYKDPGQILYVTGSLDRVEGTYGFQGRRFDVDPSSSIIFKGDWNPEVYVGVTRLISGVQARVGIYGQLPNAELRLSSIPPLDESDILSLIVFNQSTNQLTGGQQQELLVRAGTLAAAFVAKPLVTAIESETGIDILEIDPSGEFGGGPRVTIGEEIAPGLIARFSRQFGSEPYDEATIEYALSRLLRLRMTFSDAQSLSARSPFRRLERAGVDLLLFFSF